MAGETVDIVDTDVLVVGAGPKGLAAAVERGGERPVGLGGFEQDGAAVTATLRYGDGREERVRARYLVGADGAHSAVRHGAHVEFLGAPYPQDFILADIDGESPGGERASFFL